MSTPPTAADCLLHKKLAIPRQGAGHYKTIRWPTQSYRMIFCRHLLYVHTRMYTHTHMSTQEPEASKLGTAARIPPSDVASRCGGSTASGSGSHSNQHSQHSTHGSPRTCQGKGHRLGDTKLSSEGL